MTPQLEVSHKGVRGDIRASIDEQCRDSLTPESKLDIGDSILTKLRDLKTNQKDKEGVY